MRKLRNTLIVLITSLIIIPFSVNAASASISVSTSGKAVVGNTITATVTVSSGSSMGSWQFDVNYDSSKLKLISGQTSVADYTTSASGVKSKSYTLKFQTLKSGNASINIGSYLVYAIDESQMSVSAGGTSVKIMTQAELEATYSKNNNLKSLSVDGYDITPDFNKDALEYNVIVPSTVDKVSIIATKEDSTASIDGVGEKDVVEGSNPFEIAVTAQNGSIKTYKIVVTVEDINPIEVNIKGKTYNVVKRADNLEKPIGFEETTITIGEIEVPAFKSNVLNLTLVGIKDENGNIKLAIYNDNEYILYEELTSSNLTIYLLDLKELDGFIKTTITINDKEIEAYKFKSNSDFSIIYGKNVETGEEGYYVYDGIEHTFQRCNDEQVKELKKQLQSYMYVIYAFTGCLGLIFVCFIISKVASLKHKKKLKNIQLEKTRQISKEEIKEKLEEQEKNFLDEKENKKKKSK